MTILSPVAGPTAIDLGDVVPFAVTLTDDNNVAVDAGAMLLTVTLPDGTIVQPAITHGATGSYAASLATTQVGRHTLRWLATGANAAAYVDEFDVMAADPGLIIGLDYARKGLQLPANQHLNDEDLRDLIVSARGAMEDLCGPILSRNCDEWHDGGSTQIRLLWAPVLSITTVHECYGAGTTRTLSEQVLDGGSFDTYGYTIDKDDGLLTRRISGTAGTFMGGRRNIHVIYVAGRAPVPAHIRRATRRLVRWLYQSELQGGRQNTQQPDGAVTTTPNGYAVPRAVVQLCGADARVPGIA